MGQRLIDHREVRPEYIRVSCRADLGSEVTEIVVGTFKS
jgi:hypothetical protein